MPIKPLALICALAAGPVAAQDAPLSAIDWLATQRSAPPVIDVVPHMLPDANQTPVVQSAAVPDVDVQALDAPTSGGVGLLPTAVTGLPATLWQGSHQADVIAAIEALDARKPSVPALDSLLHTLLLAEAEMPFGADDTAFLQTRLRVLYDHGLVAPAEALVERVSDLTPDLFEQAFDLALLTGSDAALCRTLDATPTLSTDLATRIWCATRSGDYPRAMTIYQTGNALGQLSELDSELLLRFLDPEYAEDTSPLRAPVRPTPLQFRLFETIGETLPTTRLPRPFAVVDLSGDSGWRAQLRAAERLARAGALDGNQLLGIYSAQKPAASGGIWDRVDALQRFDRALINNDPDAVSETLVKVWPRMRSAGLLVPFSSLFAPDLRRLSLNNRATRIAGLAGLLSEDYEAVAHSLSDGDTGTYNGNDALDFLSDIALGKSPDTVPSDVPHAAALAAAWSQAPEATRELADLPGDDRLGEALLIAIGQFASGAAGNDLSLTEALRAFRAFGLEAVARRAALQLAILDMEGARR